MALSSRTAFLLAPVLALALLQVFVFVLDGLSRTDFENGLIGIQMLFSAIPVHGEAGSPWILLSFPVFCVFSWELLEFMRDRDPLRRLSSGKIALPMIASGTVRHLFGLVTGALGMLVFNFALGMAAILLVGAIEIAISPGETGEQVFVAAIGIAYPIPLGFFVLWAYRNISRPSRGEGNTEST